MKRPPNPPPSAPPSVMQFGRDSHWRGRRGGPILLAMMAFACLPLYAQMTAQPVEKPPLFWIGANVGYGVMDHRTSGVSCTEGCPQYDGAVGSGWFVGATADWLALEHSGLSLRARYLVSSLTLTAVTSNLFTKDMNGNIVPLVRTHTLDVHLPAVMLDLTAFHAIGRWKFSAGWGISFPTGPTWESSAHIDAPAGATYANNRTDTLFFPQQKIDSVHGTQLLVLAGVRYAFPVSKHVTISPEIRASYTLTPLRTINNWKEFVVELGATVQFGFGVGEKEEPAPEGPSRGAETH